MASSAGLSPSTCPAWRERVGRNWVEIFLCRAIAMPEDRRPRKSPPCLERTASRAPLFCDLECDAEAVAAAHRGIPLHSPCIAAVPRDIHRSPVQARISRRFLNTGVSQPHALRIDAHAHVGRARDIEAPQV